MRIREIEKTFAGEWVLLENPRVSKRTGEVTAGQVIAHSPDRDNVYEAGLSVRPSEAVRDSML